MLALNLVNVYYTQSLKTADCKSALRTALGVYTVYIRNKHSRNLGKLGQEEAKTLIDYTSQKSGSAEEKAEKRYITDDKVKFYVSEAKTEIVRWMSLF